jgi:hypothetical protein
MERWWTKKQVSRDRAHLRRRLLTEMGFTDLDRDVAEAVLRLAARGQVEIGEKDGRILVRSTDRVYHPDFGTRTRQFLPRG